MSSSVTETRPIFSYDEASERSINCGPRPFEKKFPTQSTKVSILTRRPVSNDEFGVDIRRLAKDLPQRETHVAWGQLRDGDLVKERFELLVVVTVGESHTDLAAVSQVLGTSH